MSASSLNLAKNLVGSGVLSLPAGVAAFSSNPAALGPALLMVVLAAILSAYGFFLVGRVCEETKTSTFGTAWEKTLSRGAWVPQVVCILECLGGSVIYAMVLGDVFSSLLQGSFLPAALCSRTGMILAVAVVLFPLCCLRSFNQLAKFSLLGTIASSYVVLFVTKRFFDGSYAPHGAFYKPLVAAAGAAASSSLVNIKTLILVSILSTAYLVHFNAPSFYCQLEPNTPGLEGEKKEEKLKKFTTVAAAGFGIAAVQYALVMVFGFLTFGQATQGNVLLNYAAADKWAVAAKVAVGLSMLFGYPLQFAGLRDGILEAFGIASLPTAKHRLATAGLLAGAVAIACLFRDLGQFQAVEGALLAAFLIYVAPPLMALKVPGIRKTLLRPLIGLGVVVAVIGCVVTLGIL